MVAFNWTLIDVTGNEFTDKIKHYGMHSIIK